MRVIGHRGAAAVAPENTLDSFARALEAGVDAVEFDARMTADGHVVVAHDDDVMRTTGARGRISEMTLEQVRALDARAGFTGLAEPARIPTLDDVVAVVDGRAAMYVELKATLDERGFLPAEPVARAVVPLLAGRADVVVSSFDPGGVATIRALAPELPTALSILRGFPVAPAIEQARDAGHVQIHPAEDAVTEDVVARAHEAGLEVCCWTVNEPARARELAALGTDGIFTDDPALMMAVLRGREP